VAIDVGAALDFAGNPPFASGGVPTTGSALDLELRGGSSPDLAIADGAAGVSVYGLSASAGTPAIVTFTPRGTVALSTAWGSPYARDLAWISNTRDSIYVAAAASAGGLQIIRVPLSGGGAPSLVMAQQTAAPAIGIAGAWTGTLGAALGAGGVGLLKTPGAALLDRITTGAAAPFTPPVTLARGAPWAATGAALEVAAFQAASSGSSALSFESTAGPIPDLLISDGPRLLALRPGSAPVTGIGTEQAAPAAPRLTLRVAPNPVERIAIFEVGSAGDAVGGSSSAAGAALGPVRLEIFDVRGRLVRRWNAQAAGAGVTSPARIAWDGLDDSKRRVGSGRYWARVTRLRGGETSVARFLVLR
jgi:hypothetical protein